MQCRRFQRAMGQREPAPEERDSEGVYVHPRGARLRGSVKLNNQCYLMIVMVVYYFMVM